ncbi:FAD-dependent oxidoreductase [Pseudonocardia sp. C8]|uniref:FAD-dependent oxidoreductase n=1 Tax=Pseudonocardia sp. C8 TaxID=2762759 RepID=UPI0016433168|nr:FAD-dependent oxidoreductase [Pseudonocardia sp. C8]MBC3195082.1 FAD-dependent oxidoreductase [Pseudonocardia sp. C8]
MGDDRRAVVVGAGIAGLSCAVRLQERGWSVRVLTDGPVEASTSHLAAAVWFPTRAGPRDKVLDWGRRTYDTLAAQARAGVPGVVMRESLALHRTEPGPQWWADAVGEIRPARPDELPPGYPYGLRFAVPLVEMPVYLPWLAAEAQRRGITLEHKHIASLAAAGEGADLVVNCAGLGARTLVGDLSVTPVRGQIVRVTNPGLTLSVRDEDHPGGRAYVHPRVHDCILGGTLDEGAWDTNPDPAVGAAIVRRCLDIAPALRGAEVLEHVAGLRPARPEVRLEAEPATAGRPRVIHDYGHGGSGITLSWGCADDVAALAGQA